MTLQEVLEVSLRRVGLTETATDFKDQARLYANIVAKDIIGESNWWWARRTGTFSTTRRITVTVPSTVSSYQDGETVTTSGGYSATIKSWDSTNNYLYVYSENAVTPSGTLTGGTSGMTSTYSSRELTRTYLLSSDVDKVHYFVNETDGTPLSIIGSESYVESDPERDDTGDAGAVVVEGLDLMTARILSAGFTLAFRPPSSLESHAYTGRKRAMTKDLSSNRESILTSSITRKSRITRYRVTEPTASKGG